MPSRATAPEAQRLCDTAVVVVAAGLGTRLGAGLPKALVPVGGSTVLRHCLDRLVPVPDLRRIVVVGPPTHLDDVWAEVDALTAGASVAVGIDVVPGGADRRSSVAAGVGVLNDADQVVLVHDAARCLTPSSLVTRVVAAVRAHPDSVVVPGLPVTDTIKVVRPDGLVTATPPRESLRGIQTPQGMTHAVAARLHAEVPAGAAVTDDAGMAELLGIPVRLVEGAREGYKVTHAEDLALAARALARAEESR